MTMQQTLFDLTVLIDNATPTDDMPVVVAYGAGLDSTAMLIGLHARGERVDLILFADTGSEKPETYAYLAIMNLWLAKVGYPQITIVKNASPIAGDKSLHEECLRKSVLPSLAYGTGMHSCSIKWKVEPQLKFCRQFYRWNGRKKTFAHGPYIVKLVGYDAGPADARRIKKSTDVWPDGHINRYPLKEWGWDRERCEQEIIAAGLPVPMKSACFMCPANKKHEVEWLAGNHPDLLAISVQMEDRAHDRGLRSCKGLGRTWRWGDVYEVDYDDYTAEAKPVEFDLLSLVS